MFSTCRVEDMRLAIRNIRFIVQIIRTIVSPRVLRDPVLALTGAFETPTSISRLHAPSVDDVNVR